jgi:hypothetical protein
MLFCSQVSSVGEGVGTDNHNSRLPWSKGKWRSTSPACYPLCCRFLRHRVVRLQAFLPGGPPSFTPRFFSSASLARMAMRRPEIQYFCGPGASFRGNYAQVWTASTLLRLLPAIALGWRGRSKWEPSEEDLSKGPQKVGSLLAAVFIVAIWAQMNDQAHFAALTNLAISLGGIYLLFLPVYSSLISTQTYEIVVAPNPHDFVPQKISGGFWLTEEAKREKRKNRVTTQDLLKGAHYNPDILWSRLSRGLAKLSFVISYILLTVCGTLALTCAAIILDLKGKK